MECMTDEDPMMSEDNVRKLIEDVDMDGDGAIDYSEFLEMMKRKE
jgi:Ca2+-binding EF-hand superfamily protein